MRFPHSPRIWFLAVLAAIVASFGWNVFHAEEDPNDTFVHDRTESVLYLYLDAPGGTSLDSNASPATIGVLLERYSWEIWRQPSTGIEQYQNAQVTPESGAMVTLTRSPEVGSLADSTLITGSDGRAWTTFAPEGYSGAVSVQASVGESNASLSFDLTTTSNTGWEEQWSFSHTEATLTASLGSAASTYDVPSGESRELSLSVYYETWDVEVSNFGNSRTVNLTGAPAVGASVSWSVEMGDGYVTGSGQTDGLGQCPATLTVGSSSGNVRAEVSFSTGSATSATLAFSPSSSSPPTPNWYHIGSSITPSITGLSPIGGTSLAHGQSIQISGTLQGDVWDLWSNGTQEESRYSYTTPLAWTSLLAEIAQGGGSLDSSSPTTQWDGTFSTGYTMGYSPSRIDLRSASTNEVLASVDFTLSEEPPATGGPAPGSSTILYSDGGYAIQNLTVDGPTYDLLPGDSRTIGGTLYWVNWDVVSDGNGTIENRITSSSPVSWSSLSAVVDYGDGTLSSTNLTSGSLGEFSTTITMGAVESKVTFSAMSGTSTAASMVFTPPQAVGNQGVKISDESLISVAFEADPDASTTTLLPGQSVPLRARVLSTSWEVWQIEGGTTELRNHETRPAIGAIVNFSQVSGPGSLSSWQAETDADGIASVDFMLGEEVSLIRADASFFTATAVAEVQVSPEIWVYDSSYDELELALSLHGPTETPNAIGATLQVRSTEIWRNLATDATEARQQLSSPAENASIVFSTLEGDPATFGLNPSFTDYTGNTIIEYRSNGVVNVAATAIFAGKTITATMLAPQGWGLAGTEGGGTGGTDGGGTGGTDGGGTGGTDGSGTGGTSGGGTGGTSGGGTGGTSGGGTGGTNGGVTGGTNGGGTGGAGGGSGQETPDVPHIFIRGRFHNTAGGGGDPGSDGGDPTEEGSDTTVTGEGPSLDPYYELLAMGPIDNSYDEVTLYARFSAVLSRNLIASDGVTVTGTEETTVEGAMEEKDTLLDPFHQAGWTAIECENLDPYSGYQWRVVFAGSYQNTNEPRAASGEAFEVYGRETQSSEPGVLKTLAEASEIRDLHEQMGDPPNPAVFWTGSVGDMAFGSANWTPEMRWQEGISNSSITTMAFADFPRGIAPGVGWSEYWAQTETPVPSEAGPQTSSLCFQAVRLDEDGEIVATGTGRIVFTINGGDKISSGAPTIETLTGNLSGWIVAQADGSVRVQPPVERGNSNRVSLLPVDLTAHRRGTIEAPGAAIPRSGGNEVYEVVTLENADYDETDWTPTSMADGALETKQDGKTDVVSTDKDDDFVKLRLSCPLIGVAGRSEIIFDQAGQGERMQDADIRFHTSNGERVQRSALKIDDLQNPSGPLAPAFTGGGLDLFVEIGDLGKTTTAQGSAESTTRKYADLIWKITTGGTTIEQKVRIYRGGFWRNNRTDNSGTIALYDGKGRTPAGTIDYGQIVKGPYRILTGREDPQGNWVTDETTKNYGPTPRGWYGLWDRNPGDGDSGMRKDWLLLEDEWYRPQTNHHRDKDGNNLGFVQQGSYCQWSQAGNHNIVDKGVYGYDNGNDSDSYQGMPDSIHFKFELSPVGDFTTRTYLQIHPDGFCDGTAGCVGIQAYDDCCKVLYLVRHYFQTRLLVD